MKNELSESMKIACHHFCGTPEQKMTNRCQKKTPAAAQKSQYLIQRYEILHNAAQPS